MISLGFFFFLLLHGEDEEIFYQYHRTVYNSHPKGLLLEPFFGSRFICPIS